MFLRNVSFVRNRRIEYIRLERMYSIRRFRTKLTFRSKRVYSIRRFRTKLTFRRNILRSQASTQAYIDTSHVQQHEIPGTYIHTWYTHACGIWVVFLEYGGGARGIFESPVCTCNQSWTFVRFTLFFFLSKRSGRSEAPCIIYVCARVHASALLPEITIHSEFVRRLWTTSPVPTTESSPFEQRTK